MVAALLVLSLLVPAQFSELRRDLTTAYRSIYQVQYSLFPEGSCTVFRVKKGTYFTALHCLQPDMKVAGVMPLTLGIWEDQDMAALWIDPELLDGPSLTISRVRAQVGDETVAIGFGGLMGFQFPAFGKISAIKAQMFDYNGMMIWGGFVVGQSGGPVLNERLEVISIVLAAGNPIGIYQFIGIGAQQDVVRLWADKWL